MQGRLPGLDADRMDTAEHTGRFAPDGMQRLLRKADRNVDGVRDSVRTCVFGK